MTILEIFGALCALYLFVKFFWIVGRTIRVLSRDYVIESMSFADYLRDFVATFFHLWFLEFWHIWMDLALKDD